MHCVHHFLLALLRKLAAVDMVGTMHLRMTVQASCRGIDGIGRTVMRSGMTALAKHRITHLEHRPLVGAVRVVAIAAILCDGLMTVKERTALAGVAAVARIVGVPFLRHRFVARLRTMRVVAGHAVHLTGEQRMCSRFKEICFLFSVAGNAKRRGRPII